MSLKTALSTRKFLIHYGWRETATLTPQPAVTDEFLIHYGWRETRNENAQTVFHIWFLIHYGWRETHIRVSWSHPNPGF